jgi:hypothetical protein
MNIPILKPRNEWACPNCDLRDVTSETRPHSRFHPCAGMSGLTAPMVPAKDVDRNRVQVKAIEREDYLGDEIQATDENGRPIMAVRTEYADGRIDCAVNAPVAQSQMGA